MRKPQLFLKRHPRYRNALIIALVLIAGCGLFFAITGSQLPAKVWLPETSRFTSDDDVLDSLPVKSEATITKYGRALRYATTADWTTIYEFDASPVLKPSSCPNITNIEAVLPSGCDRLGSLQGPSVYAMHRSLPSGATEYYVHLGQTFIYVIRGGDGGESLDYLNTFVGLSHDAVNPYLAVNSTRVNAVKAKRQAEKAATDHANATAYTRLDFSPALPTKLPAGWHLETNVTTNPIQLDGLDADHPSMVNLDYTNSNKQFVSVHSGKLSNFVVGAQCGPTPGYSMENLACYSVAGTDYYEAVLYDERNDFVRYLYRPVGDCLVISQIEVVAENDTRPSFPTELAKTQDAITLSAVPTDKASLKGSTFSRSYY